MAILFFENLGLTQSCETFSLFNNQPCLSLHEINMAKLVIIDDEAAIRTLVTRVLGRRETLAEDAGLQIVLAQTLSEAKRAFEGKAGRYGVAIKHYHADNGIFEAREFQETIFTDGQTISFCGVNAHHQNGRAEKKIRDLQELTRTMILHAQNRWPNAISAHLWPMAMKNANLQSKHSHKFKYRQK